MVKREGSCVWHQDPPPLEHGMKLQSWNWSTLRATGTPGGSTCSCQGDALQWENGRALDVDVNLPNQPCDLGIYLTYLAYLMSLMFSFFPLKLIKI